MGRRVEYYEGAVSILLCQAGECRRGREEGRREGRLIPTGECRREEEEGGRLNYDGTVLCM